MASEMRNKQRHIAVTRTLSLEVLYHPVIALLTSNIFEHENSVRGLMRAMASSGLVLRWRTMVMLNKI